MATTRGPHTSETEAIIYIVINRRWLRNGREVTNGAYLMLYQRAQ